MAPPLRRIYGGDREDSRPDGWPAFRRSIQFHPSLQHRLDSDRSLEPFEVGVLDMVLDLLAGLHQRRFLHYTLSRRPGDRANDRNDLTWFVQNLIRNQFVQIPFGFASVFRAKDVVGVRCSFMAGAGRVVTEKQVSRLRRTGPSSLSATAG